LNKSHYRNVLIPIIYIGYRINGRVIRTVRYLKEFQLWYYKTDRYSFLSTGPGWAYSYNFLLDTLKRVSCFYYLPKEGDVVVDIGAGIGEEAIILSDLVGESGYVHSIEAHPNTFKALKYIINDNALKNVRIYNLAISDKVETVKIEDVVVQADSYLGNSILNTEQSDKYFNVEGITFDEFVKSYRIEKIDLLRTNIEGAEQLLIKGMDESIRIVQNVAISCHDFRHANGEGDFFKTKEKVVAFLTEKGFRVSTQQTPNSMINDYVYAVKL
jgi:FkbM family methyltransferase